jgi:hypothetical protein
VSVCCVSSKFHISRFVLGSNMTVSLTVGSNIDMV